MKGFGAGVLVAAVICAFGYLHLRDGWNQKAGRYEQQITTLDSTIQYHRSHRDVVHDTVRVVSGEARQAIARYRRLRDSLAAIQPRDTAVLAAADSTLDAAADDAVSKCERSLNACALGLAADSALIRDLQARIAVTDRARSHDKRKAFLEKIGWAAAGYLVGSLTK